MKALVLITKSNWGGAQRYVYDLAVNLPKELYDVEVMDSSSRRTTVLYSNLTIKYDVTR